MTLTRYMYNQPAETRRRTSSSRMSVWFLFLIVVVSVLALTYGSAEGHAETGTIGQTAQIQQVS